MTAFSLSNDCSFTSNQLMGAYIVQGISLSLEHFYRAGVNVWLRHTIRSHKLRVILLGLASVIVYVGTKIHNSKIYPG